MKLTIAQIDKAKPRKSDHRLSDGNGLFLTVRKHGTKTWTLRFKRDGKDAVKTLGTYPAMQPKEARALAANLKLDLSKGIDPAKKAAAALPEATFAEIAVRYMAREKPHWAAGHYERFRSRMVKDVFPAIGTMQIDAVRPRDVMVAVNGISARGSQNTAIRVAGMIGQVCRYAVALSLRDDDPTVHIGDGLDRAPKTVHRPALTDPAGVGQLMADLADWAGETIAKPYLLMCALTFQRPGEVAAMQWDDIDLDARQWAFNVSKVGLDHIVPLSDQAMAVLASLAPLQGRAGQYVFRSGGTSGFVTPQVGMKLLDKLGYHGTHTAHGFRATARTLIVERLRIDRDLVERQLSHAARETLGRAYDRTAFIEDRSGMMQRYADYLDELRDEAGGTLLLAGPNQMDRTAA
ncbi:tyrosine-type recombinase/integrase [Tateyamaria sp.]|uniref:tyrosine-type recombinase/integrase n=1 Tax=Tateyamaria sp. TaxID=1929288 RepID=UPI00329BE857